MHRLAAVPGSTSSNEGPVFIEQPPAALVVLSSADTDLTALAALLDQRRDLFSSGALGGQVHHWRRAIFAARGEIAV